ncbi:40S ribosomal protein S22-A [Halteromyces radiatus]|uniref:40S ribosomal protein S22-A n=1 Tax=Halteromyces radiatus TaxID=101107 RepID=UPI0022201AB2|nr:40S ribosomal protein S22-A [Halteromyces radiatus]KAI8093375.1 40S ribosomal protein S22-A [Halteromyces radiatus]
MDVLATCLKAINNAERCGRRQVLIKISSKVVFKFLCVMLKHGYIGELDIVDDHRSGKVIVQLNGRLNKCGAICPRYYIKVTELEKYRSKFLPARQFGKLVLSTSAGIMDFEEAHRKHLGGHILGFFY